ncbi:MAG TPA: copper homeostasis protein CutC [Actinomycetales bacterium]|nr:copper homeostasis protein CutC [Actinomycetales bacterium]
MSATRAVEIAVQDLEGVRTALAAGADRIELCMGLGLGGLTPSIGLIECAVDAAREAGVEDFVHVLIRPRGGDFVYDEAELQTATRDVHRAVAAGVDGVVIGALTRDGEIDLSATEDLVAASQDADVTFHRAFDVVANRRQALDRLADLGVLRVLTSGGAPTCAEGVDSLTELVTLSDNRVEIMAGGGLRVEDIPVLLDAGLDAVHLSARRSVTGGSSGPGGGIAQFDQTDAEIVRAAVAARYAGEQ